MIEVTLRRPRHVLFLMGEQRTTRESFQGSPYSYLGREPQKVAEEDDDAPLLMAKWRPINAAVGVLFGLTRGEGG